MVFQISKEYQDTNLGGLFTHPPHISWPNSWDLTQPTPLHFDTSNWAPLTPCATNSFVMARPKPSSKITGFPICIFILQKNLSTGWYNLLETAICGWVLFITIVVHQPKLRSTFERFPFHMYFFFQGFWHGHFGPRGVLKGFLSHLCCRQWPTHACLTDGWKSAINTRWNMGETGEFTLKTKT